MTLPTTAITVDWNGDGDHTDTYDDIATDSLSMMIRHGIAERGVANVIVNNIGGKYNPDNSGGVLYGSLKPGRRIWIRATYSGTTYPLFYGVIRRIVPHPEDRTAEIVAEDVTCEWDLRDANLALSTSRSLRTFRGALLDLVDSTAARRSLAYGEESTIPGVTGADGKSGGVLAYLSQIDEATGTLSYIVPSATTGTFYVYTTTDRASLQAAAADEAWDAETSAGAITGLTNLDLTDEAIVNSQMVTAQPAVLATSARVWTSDLIPFTVSAGATRTIWADYSGPVSGAYAGYTATNTPTVTLTSFYETGKITVTAGVSATEVTDLGVYGRLATPVESSASSEDTTSQAAPPTGYGYRRGQPVSSPWLASFAYAQGLADYTVWRYKDPKVRPDVTRANVFPSVLQRLPGDVVTLTSGRASLTTKRLLIRTVDLAVDAASGLWVATYETEELPAVATLFTVGGSAGEGVGGTGILAY